MKQIVGAILILLLLVTPVYGFCMNNENMKICKVVPLDVWAEWNEAAKLYFIQCLGQELKDRKTGCYPIIEITYNSFALLFEGSCSDRMII